ncbi:MAG: four helix bundle protein [Bacteroidales bacterium]|jgi:four helix bundle suffix protein|nr:four helix bundle protein [Bacteroidales bacterium]
MGKMQLNNFGYYWLDTWVLASIIQLATQEFCLRNLTRTNDPCGRQFDQMTQAARSVPANIAEGNSRHATSKETEMRLTDVARASLSELANDYINWLLQHEQVPWSVTSEEHRVVSFLPLDRPTYKNDVQHLSSLHILVQKHKFDKWLCAKNSITEANCILVLCNRLIMMLGKQLENQLQKFKQEGGFAEALTAERLAYRVEQSTQIGAPACPKCGKPMLKQVAKKGINLGKEFWSCSNYPECKGTRKIGD